MDFQSKQQRFRRPEFQEKLARARQYQRKSLPVDDGPGMRFFRRIGLGSKILRFAVLVFMLVIGYYLFLSRAFLVSDVSLEENSPGPGTAEIAGVLRKLGDSRVYLIPENHMLFLSRGKLLSVLQINFPEVREITFFRRSFPNHIALSLEVRKSEYVWQSGQKYYLLDQDGVVFQEVGRYFEAAFPEILIKDGQNREVAVGQKLEIKKILAFIQNLKELWPGYVTQTTFTAFFTPAIQSPDLVAETLAGFRVLFDLDRSASVQLQSLRLLLNETIPAETIPGLSYIDLRLPATAYYCYKDAPCALESNQESRIKNQE